MHAGTCKYLNENTLSMVVSVILEIVSSDSIGDIKKEHVYIFYVGSVRDLEESHEKNSLKLWKRVIRTMTI